MATVSFEVPEEVIEEITFYDVSREEVLKAIKLSSELSFSSELDLSHEARRNMKYFLRLIKNNKLEVGHGNSES